MARGVVESMKPALVPIQVVQVTSTKLNRIELAVPQGSRLTDAVARSRLTDTLSPDLVLGVHGRIRASDTVVQAGDRIEIYRPLLADPKAARRLRAGKKKQIRARAGSE